MRMRTEADGMDEIEIEELSTPELDAPVFIEGMPGVGLVGKLAVDQLVEELDGEPIRRVYSEHFPPGVSIEDEGRAELASMTVHALHADSRDLLVLGGDGQADETVGQYRLASAALDIAEEFDPSHIVALGGFGTGEQVQDYYVTGATGADSEEFKRTLRDVGVRFESENGPSNIVGMSGLLVGLGARRGFDTAGLLGITPGFHVDPASARAVLEVLQESFSFEVELDTLSEQAEQVQELLDRIQQLQQQPTQEQTTEQSGEHLRYFR